VSQEKLTELHLREIMQLCLETHFSQWLTTEQLWIDIAKKARGLNTRDTKEEVNRWKEIIQIAQDYYDELPETDIKRKYKTEDGKEVCIETEYDPEEDFVERLAEKKPDTKRKVQNIINQIKDEQLEVSKEYEAFLKRQANEAEKLRGKERRKEK